MKTHTIKTPTAELLIVELPEGSEPLSLIGNSFFYYEKDMIKEDYPKSLTLATYYTLLGKPSEIKEEDAMELVEHHETLGYRSYKSNSEFPIDVYIYETATESLLSLMDTEIYWNENPYSGVLAMEFPTAFEEAELRTFDRNRTLIFVKN